MNGAETLVRTLLASNVDVCFANPGTSEMHFVAALDRFNGMRCVLGLFEGVVTGSADGYYRMLRRPASTLLHLGPGLANGIANLHNAKKAQSGIVNVVGEHATRHIKHNAPLTADIAGLARPVSAWVQTAEDAEAVAPLAAEAVTAAASPPGCIATLILPGNAAWDEATQSCEAAPAPAPKRVAADTIEAAARLLRSGEPTLIILGGPALLGKTVDYAGQIAGRTGCRIATQFFSARIERGVGRVALERIPYAVDAALTMLAPFRHIITLNTNEPVAFFAYPDKPSQLKPEGCDVLQLCPSDGDPLQALADLAEAVGAKGADCKVQKDEERLRPTGSLDAKAVALALRAMMPEGCIFVDESVTTGRESFHLTAGALPHDTLQNMGGSIGFSPPVATGCAIACPERPVLCVTGDGSFMYTLQALWTQVRENLNVTTVICANRKYQILLNEFQHVGAGQPGAKALSMLDIDNPTLDFVSLAKGMGMPAVRVTSAEELCNAMAHSFKEAGPSLIEAVL